MILGGLIWGGLSDILGRKPSFSMTLFLTFVFGTCSAFSLNYGVLCFLLFAMGTGVGGNLPVDGALFLEFVPPEKQSLLTLLSLFWPVGSLVTSLCAWALIPPFSCSPDSSQACTLDNNKGWRYVLFTLGCITLSMLLGRVVFFKMMESPKFLLAKGKIQEAILVLKYLAHRNGKNVQLEAKDFECLLIDQEIDDGFQEQEESIKESKKWDHVKELFSKNVWKTMILVCLIWSFTSFGYTMFNGFLPKFLKLAGQSKVKTQSQVYFEYVIIQLCGIPGSILGWWTVDTSLGRKGTMSLATFGTSLFLFAFTLNSNDSTQLICSCVVSFLQNIMWGVIYAYSPEVFHTSHRGTAVGIASALSRICGSIAPIVTGSLIERDVKIPLYISSASICFAGICMLLLPIETRGLGAM